MRIADPKLKVVRFTSEDVIATSLFAVANGSGGYDVYSGNIDSDTSIPYGWHVALGDVQYTWTQTEYDTNKINPTVENIYDAYQYNYEYYTNGVPYKKVVSGGGAGQVGGDNGLDD